jgi:hypothetical protein
MTERFTVIIAQESHSKYGYLEKERQTVEIEIDLTNKNKTLQDYCLDAAIKLGFSSYVNIKDQLEFRKPNTGVMKGDVVELHEMEPNAKYLLCLVSNEDEKNVDERTVFNMVNKALTMGKYETDPKFVDNRFVDESEWDD